LSRVFEYSLVIQDQPSHFKLLLENIKQHCIILGAAVKECVVCVCIEAETFMHNI